MAPVDRIIEATLAQEASAGCVAAYLFGSVAAGRERRDSDADIGVVLSPAAQPTPAARFEVRVRLIGRLAAALGREADVVILNDAPPQFARRIITEGRRVALFDEAADTAFRRVVLSRAADIEPFLRRTRQLKLAVLSR